MRAPRLGSAANSFRRCNPWVLLQWDARAFHALRLVRGLVVDFILVPFSYFSGAEPGSFAFITFCAREIFLWTGCLHKRNLQEMRWCYPFPFLPPGQIGVSLDCHQECNAYET